MMNATEFLYPRSFATLYSLETLDLKNSLIKDISELVLIDLYKLKNIILNDELRQNTNFIERIKNRYPNITIH